MLIAAGADNNASSANDRWWWMGGLATVFLAVSAYSFAHGRDFSPAGSVNDPALVLGTVTALRGLIVFNSALRSPTGIKLGGANLPSLAELIRVDELDFSVELDLSGRSVRRAPAYR